MRNEAHMNYLRRKTADEAELLAADRIEQLEADYHSACQTLAEMHAAAMGAVVGPRRGVVEDIADLRAERDELRFALENVRLFAARNRKEDWAPLILGFCAEGGVVGSVTR